jgi:alkylation response protein AidB-like acyl-CoA dehydrogenase
MRCDPDMLQELERTAVSFAAAHVEPRAANADHEAPAFPGEVFQHGIEAGFDRMLLPEDLGGTGCGLPELCVLTDALARSCAGHAMVFGVHAAVIGALQELTGAERVAKLLAQRAPIGLALPDPATLTTFHTDLVITEIEKGRLQLRGDAGPSFNWIPGGHLLTFARTPSEDPTALLISDAAPTELPPSPDGGSLESTTPPLGLRAMPIAEPDLDGLIVEADEALLATGEEARKLHQTLLQDLSLVSAAAAAGTMQAAHRKALAYAADRYQGGKLIADHTHIRSILGKMSASVVVAAGAVRSAALQDGDPHAALSAKLAATSGAMQVCTDAVQVLGGYGYMREFGVEKSMRDAAVLALLPASNAKIELLLAARDRDLLTE